MCHVPVCDDDPPAASAPVAAAPPVPVEPPLRAARARRAPRASACRRCRRFRRVPVEPPLAPPAPLRPPGASHATTAAGAAGRRGPPAPAAPPVPVNAAEPPVAPIPVEPPEALARCATRASHSTTAACAAGRRRAAAARSTAGADGACHSRFRGSSRAFRFAGGGTTPNGTHAQNCEGDQRTQRKLVDVEPGAMTVGQALPSERGHLVAGDHVAAGVDGLQVRDGIGRRLVVGRGPTLKNSHFVPVDISWAGSGIGPHSCSAIGMVDPKTATHFLYRLFCGS